MQKEEVFILKKDFTATDSFVRYTCFNTERGIFLSMKRRSTQKNIGLPDLFDKIESHFEKKPTSSYYFFNEFNLIQRNTSIVNNYTSFELAVEWTQMLINNIRYFENIEYLYNLTQICFESYALNKCPYIINIKALYLIARQEGLPVEADWINYLPPSDARHLIQILNKPAPLLNTNEQYQLDLLKSLYLRLKNWLKGQSFILN